MTKKCKYFIFNMNKMIKDACGIRKKDDIINLLLTTIEFINCNNLFFKDLKKLNSKDYIVVLYGRINRIFYILNKKILSISIPFHCESSDKRYIFKDYSTKHPIDCVLISCLRRLLNEKSDIDCILRTLDDVYGKVRDNEQLYKEVIDIFKKLLAYDAGYLRYDYDQERADKIYHPLNHIDINFDDCSSFKLGLLSECSCKELISIIDKKDKVRYLTTNLPK